MDDALLMSIWLTQEGTARADEIAAAVGLVDPPLIERIGPGTAGRGAAGGGGTDPEDRAADAAVEPSVIGRPDAGRPPRDLGGDGQRAGRGITAIRIASCDPPENDIRTMKKEMLINVMQPEECRIAIIEDGVLQELYVERTSQESYVNNIYKGRIVNIEPSIQAAFVDFGIGRNGFLHVSDVASAYFKGRRPRRSPRRPG